MITSFMFPSHSHRDRPIGEQSARVPGILTNPGPVSALPWAGDIFSVELCHKNQSELVPVKLRVFGRSRSCFS